MLTKPSNRNGDIRLLGICINIMPGAEILLCYARSVLLLVAELKDGQSALDINFATASAVQYSETIAVGMPYVTAEYDYNSFPNSFVLGDDTMVGQYHNAPLKPGTRYAYALRSVSATNVSELEDTLF